MRSYSLTDEQKRVLISVLEYKTMREKSEKVTLEAIATKHDVTSATIFRALHFKAARNGIIALADGRGGGSDYHHLSKSFSKKRFCSFIIMGFSWIRAACGIKRKELLPLWNWDIKFYLITKRLPIYEMAILLFETTKKI